MAQEDTLQHVIDAKVNTLGAMTTVATYAAEETTTDKLSHLQINVLHGYRLIGKPSTVQHRGVGLWIEDTLAPMHEKIPDGTQGRHHPD